MEGNIQMHKNIFPLFITFLGIVAAYTFYAVWHTEEPELNNPTQQTSKELSQTEPTEKKHIKSLPSKSSTVKTTPSLVTVKNKTMHNEEPSTSSMVSETQEETREVYEALVPESYDDTVTEAQTAFTSLDATVLKMQEHLDAEMENINIEE